MEKNSTPLLLALCLFGCVIGRDDVTICKYTNRPIEREGEHGDFIFTEPDDTPDSGQKGLKSERISSGLDGHGQVVVNGTEYCSTHFGSCFSMWTLKDGKRHLAKQGCWNKPDEHHTCVSETSEASCVGYPVLSTNSTFLCCCLGNLCNGNITEGSQTLAPKFVSGRGQPESATMKSDYRTQTITAALTSVLSLAVLILIIFLVYRLKCMPHTDSHQTSFISDTVPPVLFNMDDLEATELIERGRFGTVLKGRLGELSVAVKVFSPLQRQYYMNEYDIMKLPHMTHCALPKFYGGGERQLDGLTEYLIVMEYISEGSLAEYLRVNTVDWPTLCRMLYTAAAGLAHLHADFTKGDQFKPSIAHRDFNSRNIMVKQDLSLCLIDFGFAMRIDGCHFYRNGQEENAEHSSLSDVGTIRYMAPEVLEGAVNLRDCEASLKQIDVYALGLVIWEMGMRCHELFQGLTTPEYQMPFQAEVGLHPTFEQMQIWVSRNKQRPPFPEIWKDTNQAVRALKETIEDCWDQDAEARLTAMCVEERGIDMTSLWETRHKGLTPTITSLGDLEEKGIIQRNLMSTAPEPAPVVGPEVNVLVDQERRPPPTENSVSTATVETLLSPDDVRRSLIYGRQQTITPQKQGQNAIIAMNTHKHSDEELSVHGNSLIGRGTSCNTVTNDELLNALESSLLPNDTSSRPMVYMQNEVSVRPKKPNVPGNGNSTHVGWRSKLGDLKRKGEKIGLIFKRKSPIRECEGEKSENKHIRNCTDIGKSNLEPRPQTNTEVCMLNGNPIVRPISLPLVSGEEETEAAAHPAMSRQRSLSTGEVTPHEETTTLLKSPSDSTGNWRLEAQQRNLLQPSSSSSMD